MKKIVTTLVVAVVSLAAGNAAQAEGSAMGTDMWTRIFEQWGLFHPHADICDSSTEVFVSISGSASQGYCIEKTERAAATWETARDTCASVKKRLPEPGEWKFACANAAGLSDMTDDWEWTSNFTVPISESGATYGIAVPKMGLGTCYRASYDYIGWSGGSGSQGSVVYRCVR